MNKLQINSENNSNITKEKNSKLSFFLICINTLLVIVFITIGYNSEEQNIKNTLWVLTSLTFFLGIYAFNYNGKKYILGKWLFAIAFIFCIYYLGILLYISGLGKAFQH